MSECVRNNISLRLLLKPVIADGTCRIQRLFNVTRLKDLLRFVGMIGPDPGKKIRLQLKTNRESLVLRFAQTLALSLHFRHDAELVLNVMPYFMGDDVRPGKIARRTEPSLELIKETHVEIYFLITRTVERTCGGIG